MDRALEIAMLTCKEGFGDQFYEHLRAGLGVQARDPECLKIFVQRGLERPDEFLLNLEWTSIEAHDRWREGHREEWRSHVLHHLEGTPRLLGHYRPAFDVK